MKNNSLMLPIIHTIIILIAWSSFAWLDWKIIFVIYILYTLQMIIFKGCILTNIQMGDIHKENEMAMYAFWIEKTGRKANKLKLRFWSRWIMPLIILFLAIIWQILLNIPALININI